MALTPSFASAAKNSATALLQGLIPHLREITAIIVLGLLIYAPALHGTWVWDDGPAILDNPVLREKSGLAKIWFQPESLDYFPLTTSVQWALWQLFPGKVLPFHFLNIALHIASGLALWRLLALLGVRRGWIGGLLWVAHPVAVESVAWIAELKNTLSQFLLLLSLVSYVRWSETERGWVKYAAALFLFAAAMLAKASVVMMPVVLVLYGWWKAGSIRWKDIRATLPFFAVALLLALATVWFQFNRGIGEEYIEAGGPVSRLARAGLAVVFYLFQCVLPANVMLIYPRWNVDPPSLLQFLPWPFLGLVLFGLWKKRATWGRHALLGLGFFLLNLAPVLGFVTIAYFWITWMADHFAYISLAGVVGLAAAAASAAWTRFPRGHALLATLGFLVLGLFAWESHDYAGAFRNNEALFTRAVEKNPDAWLAHQSLAFIASRGGRPNEGRLHLAAAAGVQERILARNPDDPAAHYQLGLFLLQMGKQADAVPQFEEALRLKPDYVGAHGNLGFILFLNGQTAEAKKHFEEALRFGPDSAEIRYNLGYVQEQEGDFENARKNLGRAIELKPDYAEAHYSLAQLYQATGHPADALREYEAALRLRPENDGLRKLVESLRKDTATSAQK